MDHFPIPIPDNHAFLRQWYQWTQSVVSDRFKRNRERIPDVVQDVRARLLSKDFIGRWFFKHLNDELVDRDQAEAMLGGTPVAFVSSIGPVYGKRSSKSSLWRVSDILSFAKFDHERYYYSVQNHTVDTSTVLRLIGYPQGDYTILQSLYRQGRLRPSELTDHECRRVGAVGVPPSACPGCVHGLALLKARGLSLAHDWSNPAVASSVEKLRWNDSQLTPFLRGWKRTNIIKGPPAYIMRPDRRSGVDAGLLKYAKIIITNTVNNCFKQMQRTDDLGVSILNNGLSPELSNDETVGWEPDDSNEHGLCRTIKDSSSSTRSAEADVRRDLFAIIDRAGLTDDEMSVVRGIDLEESTSQSFSKASGMSLAKIQRLRTSALQKLRQAQFGTSPSERLIHVDSILSQVCEKYGLTRADIFGPSVLGTPVKARTDLFSALSDVGMSTESMASFFSYPEDKIVAAINRRVLREMSMAVGL